MLERAEQRAKNFGITSTLTKQPLNEHNQQQIIQNSMEKQYINQKSPSSSSPSSNAKRNSTARTPTTTTTPKSQKKNYDNGNVDDDNADNIAENKKNEQRLSRKNMERQITIEHKENVDLAVEINITSGPNVHVTTKYKQLFTFFLFFYICIINFSINLINCRYKLKSKNKKSIRMVILLQINLIIIIVEF